MYQTLQLVAVGILAVVFGLSALSRRYPHVAWLQIFRFTSPQLSEEQRARMRQRANIHAGIELILLGIVVPFGYFVLTIMMFNDPTPLGIALALGGGVLLVGLGVTAIRRNRRAR